MIKRIINCLKRNPCKKCIYYRTQNGTCQSKKVATYGTHPYVNYIDRLFCKPYKTKSEESR